MRKASFLLAAIALILLFLMAGALLRWQALRFGAHVWLVIFLFMIAIRIPFFIRIRPAEVRDVRGGLTEICLQIIMFCTMIIIPLLHLAIGWFDFAGYDLGMPVTFWGVALMLPALILFWYAHRDLGPNLSPGLVLHTDHTLVTTGIYAYIRHPMYAALGCFALAQPLLVQNWVAGALAVPGFVALWCIRVPREEAMLRDAFGPAYEAYCRKTGRLFPRRF